MPYNIQPYIPEGEVIPTRLRLLIEKDEGPDIRIDYTRSSGLSYEFSLYNVTSKEEADEIIHQIAMEMCNQSYDHGQEWRTEEIETLREEINSFIQVVEYKVSFRVKDSY